MVLHGHHWKSSDVLASGLAQALAYGARHTPLIQPAPAPPPAPPPVQASSGPIVLPLPLATTPFDLPSTTTESSIRLQMALAELTATADDEGCRLENRRAHFLTTTT